MTTRYRIRTALSIATVAMAAVVLTTTSANADHLFFGDTFDRADSTISDGTGLNESTDGKSGSLGTLDWVGRPITHDPNGQVIPSLSNVDISNGNLQIESAGSNNGNSGGIAYVNHNFIDSEILTAGQFTVSVDIITHNNNDFNAIGAFALGQDKIDIDNQTSVWRGTLSFADFYMGIIGEGGNRDIRIGENVSVNGPEGFEFNFPFTDSFPHTLTATFTVTDFNATTTVGYEAFLDGVSLRTGSFFWSGTDENYIKLQSSATGNTLFDNFAVRGVGPVEHTLILEVDTSMGGLTTLKGDPSVALEFDINSYQITSAAGSIDPTLWNSLEDQTPVGDINSDGTVDGDDFLEWQITGGTAEELAAWELFYGSGPGVGEGWEEGGAVNPNVLVEYNLLGNSTIPVGGSINLGDIYSQAGSPTLSKDWVFTYRTADGEIKEGIVLFDPVPLSAVTAAVPEPSSLVLIAVGLLGIGTRRRKQA